MKYLYGKGLAKQLAELQTASSATDKAADKGDSTGYTIYKGDLLSFSTNSHTPFSVNATLKTIEDYAKKFKSIAPTYYYSGLAPEGLLPPPEYKPSNANVEAAEAIDREFEQWINEEE